MLPVNQEGKVEEPVQAMKAVLEGQVCRQIEDIGFRVQDLDGRAHDLGGV